MQPIHEICYNQIMHLPTSTVLYTWKIFLLKDFRKTENLGASYNKHGQRTRTKTCEPQNQTQHRKAKSQKVVRYTRRNAQNTANNQTDPVTKVAIISTRKGKSVQYSGLSWEVEDGVASESEKNKISWINFVNYVTSGVCVCVCVSNTRERKNERNHVVLPSSSSSSVSSPSWQASIFSSSKLMSLSLSWCWSGCLLSRCSDGLAWRLWWAGSCWCWSSLL